MSGLQSPAAMDPKCVEQRCTMSIFLLLGNPTNKRGEIATSALSSCRHSSGLSYLTRGYEKTHAHLNSVLEQALVTTAAVGEACC